MPCCSYFFSPTSQFTKWLGSFVWIGELIYENGLVVACSLQRLRFHCERNSRRFCFTLPWCLKIHQNSPSTQDSPLKCPNSRALHRFWWNLFHSRSHLGRWFQCGDFCKPEYWCIELYINYHMFDVELPAEDVNWVFIVNSRTQCTAHENELCLSVKWKVSSKNYR